MGMEDLEKKNPWAGGDEREKQLGSEEVERIRAQHRERVSGPEPLSHAEEEFREVLMHSRCVREEFWLNDGGSVTGGAVYIEPITPGEFNDPDFSGISTCLRLSNERAKHITADDIRSVALRISQRYPDVTFEFQEDRQKKVFTYTARLQKVHE